MRLMRSVKLRHSISTQRSALLYALLASIFWLSSATSTCAQRSPEDHALEDMFRWGLNSSAIAYARRQTELNTDRPQFLARWTKRLMECYSQAALRETDLDSSLWQEAPRVLLEFESEQGANPRLPWLVWQSARNRLLHAQSCLAQYLAAPARLDAREVALSEIRSLLTELDDLDADIGERQPIAAREGLRGKTQAPAAHLESLRVDSGLMRCEALLIRARLYPAQSNDRVAAATDVDKIASEILGITGQDWDARTPLQIAKATAMLELGQAEQAVIALATIAKREESGSAARRAALIAIEYLASIGDLKRAAVLLPVLESPGQSVELELAELHISLAELRMIRNETARESKLRALLQQSRGIGERYGSYWQNRAEALLRAANPRVNKEDSVSQPNDTVANSTSLQLMIVEVRQLLAADKIDNAIEKLLEFRDNQAVSNEPAVALKLASQASALLLQQKRFNEAADAVESTSLQFAKSEGSASAHRMAIEARLQALRQNPQDTSLSDRYEESLFEQLQNWPNAAESDEPQEWLGKWLRGIGRADDYVRALWDRATGCQETDLTRNVANTWLREVLDLEKRQRDAAISDVQSELRTPDDRSVVLQVRVLAAQVLSKWPDINEAKRQSAERSKLESSVSSDFDRQLLIGLELLMQARRQDLSAARRLKANWYPEQCDASQLRLLLVEMTDAIHYATSPRSATASPQGWCDALKIDATILERVGSDSAGQKSLIWQCTDLRLRDWLGQEDSLAGLESLIQQFPRSQHAQLSLAQALAGRSDTQQLERSSSLCKRLIASSDANSDVHLAARFQWFQNIANAGDVKGAKAAARLFLASQPIESNVWAARFESFVAE